MILCFWTKVKRFGPLLHVILFGTYYGGDTMKTNYIKLIKLNNIKALSLEEFKLDAELNIVKSSNEGGKSRFLEVVEFICADRMQPAWITTDNTGEGSIECYISDGSTIKIDIENGKAKRTIKDPDGKKIVNDRAWLRDNISLSSVDAGRFFERTEWGYRVNMAVEALGLGADKEKWLEKFGTLDDLYKLIKFDEPVFNQIETADDFFRGKRRDANVAKDEHKKTVERLEASLPEKTDIDYTAKIQANSDRKSELVDQLDSDLEKDNEEALKRAEVIENKKSEIDLEIKDIEKQISELEQRLTVLNGNKKMLDQEIETEREKLRRIKQQTRESYSDSFKEISDELTQLLHEKEIIDKSAGVIEQIDNSNKAIDRLQTEWEKYQNFIDMLAKWKEEIGESIPIQGLAIEGKDLSVDGKPWRIANTAKQAEIFLQLIDLMFEGKPIKPVLMDNFESIGDGIRRMLWPKMQEGGYQGIFAQADIPLGRELRLLAGFDANDPLEK